MNPTIVSIIVAASAIAGGLLFFWLLRSAGLTPQLAERFVPVHRKDPYMTPREAVVYKILKENMGKYFEISTQVGIAALVDGNGTSKFLWSFMDKLDKKRIDYLLFKENKEGEYYTRIAIELDDRSHHLPRRRRRDKYVETAFENAYIKLFRIRRRDHDNYNEKELINQLWDYIHEKGDYRARVY